MGCGGSVWGVKALKRPRTKPSNAHGLRSVGWANKATFGATPFDGFSGFFAEIGVFFPKAVDGGRRSGILILNLSVGGTEACRARRDSLIAAPPCASPPEQRLPGSWPPCSWRLPVWVKGGTCCRATATLWSFQADIFSWGFDCPRRSPIRQAGARPSTAGSAGRSPSKTTPRARSAASPGKANRRRRRFTWCWQFH